MQINSPWATAVSGSAAMRTGRPVCSLMKRSIRRISDPPPQAQFQLSGGTYWYVGSFPASYYDERPRYAVINDAYAPMPYARPMVDIQVAPPMVRAELGIGGPGWGASVVLGGPPAPVHVAPPPPSPPVQIGVGINLGGPPTVIERREYIEDRRYHDHGRHEGWREPRRFEEHRRHDPPGRFAPGRAPLFQRAQPQHSGPSPHLAPAPRTGPGPMRGPAPAAKRDDRHQDWHR